MICKFCGKEFKTNTNRINPTKYCSRSCYDRQYYKNHKESLNAKRMKWHNEHYVYHPIGLKYSSEEEKQEAERLRRKKYYQEHKERYKELNRRWYALNGNRPDVKRRHAKAMKKYYKKRKKLHTL